jgi:hypothetical protein
MHHPLVDTLVLLDTQRLYHFVQQSRSKNDHPPLHMRLYRETMYQRNLRLG